MVKITEGRVKALAKMIHEANKAFCESIGDMSQEPWNEAPEYNHTSAMVGVQALCDNPELTPEESHDIWVKTKEADGWQYGPTKCRDKKTHPSMIPYKDLSSVEKYKDHLVRSIVKSYLDFVANGAC